ncbi:hypothetical protein STEG23_021878, partial [Scotinomys teguina]
AAIKLQTANTGDLASVLDYSTKALGPRPLAFIDFLASGPVGDQEAILNCKCHIQAESRESAEKCTILCLLSALLNQERDICHDYGIFKMKDIFRTGKCISEVKEWHTYSAEICLPLSKLLTAMGGGRCRKPELAKALVKCSVFNGQRPQPLWGPGCCGKGARRYDDDNDDDDYIYFVTKQKNLLRCLRSMCNTFLPCAHILSWHLLQFLLGGKAGISEHQLPGSELSSDSGELTATKHTQNMANRGKCLIEPKCDECMSKVHITEEKVLVHDEGTYVNEHSMCIYS